MQVNKLSLFSFLSALFVVGGVLLWQANGLWADETAATPTPVPETAGVRGSAGRGGTGSDTIVIDARPWQQNPDAAQEQDTHIPEFVLLLEGHHPPVPQVPTVSLEAERPSTAEDAVLVTHDLRQNRTYTVEDGVPLSVAPELEQVTEPVGQSLQEASGFSALNRVSNVGSYPWRATVKVWVTHDEIPDQPYRCSGALIDPKYVITAGNCIYDYGESNNGYGWARDVTIVPAYDNGNKLFGEAVATNSLHSFQGWTVNGKPEWAVGFIQLDRRPIGVLSGWYGYGYNNSDSHFTSNTFQNPGYPNESPYDDRYMRNWSGSFDIVATESLRHTRFLDDFGFLGSTIFTNSSNPVVLGLYSHVVGTSYTAYARLTKAKVDVIQNQIVSTTPTALDLIPLDVRISPQTAMAGQQLDTLTYVIHNYSTKTWDGTVTLDLYLSTNNNISASEDTYLQTVTTSSSTGSIGPKDWINITSNNPPQIPDNVSPGNYWIGIILRDSSGPGNNDSDGWDAAALQVVTTPGNTPTPTGTATPQPPTPTQTATPTAPPEATATGTRAPTQTPTATVTQTVSPTPSATPSPTTTSTATVTLTVVGAACDPTRGVNSVNCDHLFLPMVERAKPVPTPTITATPTVVAPATPFWRLLGGANLNAATIAIQGNQLYVGDRRAIAAGGGLFIGNLAGCAATVSFNRQPSIPAGVFAIEFRGDGRGMAALYDEGMFYSPDAGNSWLRSNSSVIRPGSVTTVNNSFFAGSQDQGIYQSDNDGIDWRNLQSEQQVSLPNDINALRVDSVDPNKLWIGTETGVYGFTVGANREPSHPILGLAGESLKVWDLAFDTANDIYLATMDGIYRGNAVSAWQRFGTLPAGMRFLSLELVGDQLYAGALDRNNAGNQAGVWHRPLTSGDWAQLTSAGWNPTHTVRDLLYDGTHCQGLLAATGQGIWLYAKP